MDYNRLNIYNKLFKTFVKQSHMDDDCFNCYANTFKINRDYNMVIWCDIDNNCRYYIVSIRYNPYDELFGEDVGFEVCSNDNSIKELISAARKVLDKWKAMRM